jgi:hypothetical protein
MTNHSSNGFNEFNNDLSKEIENKSDANHEAAPVIGRNEPCPCGSGKKYKRCCGVSAAPKLSQPKMNPGEMPALPPGLENMDPQMMMQAAQMLQRLPRGQLQRLQSIMQRAMAGKDVTREAEEFQKTLPPDFQQMMTQFAMAAGGMGAGMPAEGTLPALEAGGSTQASSPSMTEEEARAIIERAAKQGKLSEEQAQEFLKTDATSSSSPSTEDKEGKGIGKFWKNLTGKQS